MQKIISLDSQILNAIQLCPKRTELGFIYDIQPQVKAEPLEKGSLIHDMLEIYYALLGKCARVDTEIWADLMIAGLFNGYIEDYYGKSFADRVRFCIEAGHYRASKTELEPEDAEVIIYQFKEYCEHYQHDSWHPLAVEEVGSKILFEDETTKIIYNFKIDMVAEQGSIIAPFDHKTSSRRQAPNSLSNQFIGYCFGLDVNNIVINKIGFQKTLSRSDRFQRFILTIDQARIEEWKANSTYWAFEILKHQESNYWPMNLTSCDKYSGCIYSHICEKTPESRQMTIDRDYRIGEKWDVASILEDKKE